ncbi:hypothetical protein WA026_022219 [Henosepilachna vigintioctopunctata]|uniref:Anoctamin n=1 Tax=Henosepilachna vigintioctopunctata TaxID=420089 RepID=A0AAW1UPB3_9CUCU
MMFPNQTLLLLKLHSKFLTDIYHGSKLYEHSVSAIPSFIFFVFSFVLLFEHFHRYSRRRTRWKMYIYRELGFQSSFFYVTRFWFIVMKLFKWISAYFEHYIEKVSPPVEVYFNKIFTKFCILCALICLSLIPATIILVQYLFKDEMPNFLLWAGENRWMRTEIGPAGQLLENAARLTIPSKNCKNLSRRTASAEANLFRSNSSLPNCVRGCRSMVVLPNLRERTISHF